MDILRGLFNDIPEASKEDQYVFINLWSPKDDIAPTNTDLIDFVNDALDRITEKELDSLYDRHIKGSINVETFVNNKQEYYANVKNANDALLIAMILLQPKRINETKINNASRKVLDYVKSNNNGDLLFNELKILHEYFPMIKDNKVIEPKTGKKIKYLGNAYKKIFRLIRLKHNNHKKLSNLTCYDYDVDDTIGCVPSFLNTQHRRLGAKLVKKIISELPKYPTYPELSTVLNNNDIGLSVYTVELECLEDQSNKEYKNHYNICITNEHLYVIKSFNKVVKKVIELDEVEYNQKLTELTEEYYIIECESEFIVNHIKYKKKFSNNYKFLNKIFKYKNSNFSHINIDIYDNAGIRPPKYCNNDLPRGTGLDINSAYSNIVKNVENVFCSNTGNEYITEFKGGEVMDDAFYIVDIRNEEAIYFFPSLYNVGVLGKVINEYHRIFDMNVLYKIEGSYSVRGVDFDKLPEEHKKELDDIYLDKEDLLYDYDLLKTDINQYIGLLARTQSYKTQIMDIKNTEEREAIYNKYPMEYSISDNKIKLTRRYLTDKANPFINMSIMDINRMSIIKLYLIVKKMIPNIKIFKVLTDAIYFDQILTPQQIKDIKIKSKINFKIESSGYTFDTSEVKTSFNPKKYLLRPINKIIEWKRVLDKKESLMIAGLGGMGKSFLAHNEIIPYIKELGYKYMSFGSAIENGKAWDNGHIHQWVLKKDGINQILKTFEDIDYIIIDEITLLSMSIFHILEILKENGKKFIFIGDKHQCLGVDNIEYTEKEFFKRLVDYNYLTLDKWEENKTRFTKPYFDFLNEIIALDNKQRIFLYACSKIQLQTTRDINPTEINISWRRKTADKSTVHKSQGKTHKELITIYELDEMTPRIAYTALSRVGDFKDIQICLE